MASVSRASLEFADEPIVRVDPSDTAAVRCALGVLLTGRQSRAAAAVDQFLQFVHQQGLSLDRLWTLGPGRDPRGAVMIAPNPGRTGMLFISPATRTWQRASMVRLVRAAVSVEDRQQITMIQSLLDPGQDAEAAALLDAGFERLGMLAYLQRKAQAGAGEPLTDGGLRVLHWSPQHRSLFERAILSSYEGTLDCPGLLGRRTIGDIIAGHMATGLFDPQLWTVCLSGDEPAAVMLLSELPAVTSGGESMELVYLGVSAAYRGRGLARRMVRHALTTAAARRSRHVVLAVDEANTPAMTLYRGFGFRTTARKLALLTDVG